MPDFMLVRSADLNKVQPNVPMYNRGQFWWNALRAMLVVHSATVFLCVNQTTHGRRVCHILKLPWRFPGKVFLFTVKYFIVIISEFILKNQRRYYLFNNFKNILQQGKKSFDRCAMAKIGTILFLPVRGFRMRIRFTARVFDSTYQVKIQTLVKLFMYS